MRCGQGLNSDELSHMLKNVLQLSAANKITSSNTWELKLIDHLDSLVKESGPPLITDPWVSLYLSICCRKLHGSLLPFTSR